MSNPDRPRYCAEGWIVTFSLTSRESFLEMTQLLQLVLDRSYEEFGNDKIIFLVGTKADLQEERQVSEQEARQLAHSFNVSYFETSAATGLLSKRIFYFLAYEIYKAKMKGRFPRRTNTILPPTKRPPEEPYYSLSNFLKRIFT